MKSKIVAAMAVLTLSASLAVAAPGEGGHGGKRGRQGEVGAKLAQKLNLTAAQQEQIKAIHKQTREENAAFFDTARQTRQELRAAKEANDTARVDALKGTLQSQRAQMKQIRQAEKERVMAILTPEQRTQFEQLQAERGQRRHGGKRGNTL